MAFMSGEVSWTFSMNISSRLGSVTSKRVTRACCMCAGEKVLGVIGKSWGGMEPDLGLTGKALDAFDAGVMQERVVALEGDVDAVVRDNGT